MLNKLNCLPLLSAVLILCCSVASGDEGLTTLKQKFNTALKQYDADAENETRKLELHYFSALDTLEKRFQANGELEPLIEVRKEKERYHTEKSISADDLSTQKTLLGLQSTFMEKRDLIPVEKARKIIKLKDQYISALESYQKKLTKENKLEAAILVKNERDAISNIPQVSEAEFIIAEIGPEQVAEETQPAARPAEQKHNEAEKVNVVEKKKWAGDADNYIRRRFNDFMGDLEDRDMDAAIKYVDPEYLQEHGEGMARGGLNILAGIVARIEREPGAKLSVRTVEVNDEETQARLVPKVLMNNQWHDTAPQEWVRREGDWFLRFGNNQGEGTARDVNRHFDRQERGGDRARKRAWNKNRNR